MSINQDELFAHLEHIRRELARQNSLTGIFYRGVVYGIGFVVGSAVIATILLGLFGPWFAQIPWIRDAFVEGAALVR